MKLQVLISRLLLACVLLAFPTSSRAQEKTPRNGKYTEKYVNGSVKVEGRYKKGVKHGEWVWYHTNGKVERKETYMNGKLEGASVTFGPGGTLLSKIKFRDGVNHGEYIGGTGDGKRAEGSYKNDKPDSLWRYYFLFNNKLAEEGMMKDGLKEGLWKQWDKNGNIVEEVHYKEDKRHGPATIYFFDGSIQMQVNFKNNLPHGPYKEYRQKEVYEEGAYLDGSKHGAFTRYWQSTDKLNPDVYKQAGQYEKGLMHGKYEIYKNDKLHMTGEFMHDRKDGKETVYYDNGQVKRETIYKQGLVEGIEKFYYPSGKPEAQKSFVKDKPAGKWTEWYEDGKLRAEAEYGNLGWKQKETRYYPSGKIKYMEVHTKGMLRHEATSYYPNGQKSSHKIYQEGDLVKVIEWDEKGKKIKEEDKKPYNDYDDVIVPPPGAVVESVEEDQVYTVVQEMPEFVGGDILAHVNKNAVYPKEEMEKGISGTVWVEFIASKDGTVQNARIVKSPPNAPGLEKEALRVVNSIPSFKPGKQAGRPVSVRYTVPVRFSLK